MIEVIDITNMTIQEINSKIKKLNNQLNYYLGKKKKEFDKTQPSAVRLTGDKVKGGRYENNIEMYVEYKNDVLDPFIDNIQDEIYRLTRYVEDELERTGEYELLALKIIDLRDNKVNNRQLTWNDIAEKVSYCERQCRRIYKRYKGKRNI